MSYMLYDRMSRRGREGRGSDPGPTDAIPAGASSQLSI